MAENESMSEQENTMNDGAESQQTESELLEDTDNVSEFASTEDLLAKLTDALQQAEHQKI